jgi:hypothetical protein
MPEELALLGVAIKTRRAVSGAIFHPFDMSMLMYLPANRKLVSQPAQEDRYRQWQRRHRRH